MLIHFAGNKNKNVRGGTVTATLPRRPYPPPASRWKAAGALSTGFFAQLSTVACG